MTCNALTKGASAKPFIAVIESRPFVQDRIRHGMQSALSLPIILYSSVSELEGQLRQGSPDLVIFSLMESDEASVSALKLLLELVPTVPIVIFAFVDEVDLARNALRLGVKGYVPITKGFDLASEAVRFVLCGRGLSAGRPPGGSR